MIRITVDRELMDLVMERVKRMNDYYTPSNQPSLSVVYNDARATTVRVKALAAECAVAQYLNQQWAQADPTKPFDVAPNIEVRSGEPPNGLYIKAREVEPGKHRKPPSTIYVKAFWTSNVETVDLVGFTQLDYGLSAATKHIVNGRTNGYIVNTDRLWPMERLYATLN